MRRVSVIVPVYNAEKYLKRCVDSLLGQTFTDFEVILVDDGSTDGSGKMCDDYARSNPQVCVFHQSNQGVSAARQAGLDAARGEYITFADPDDWVEPLMLESLYHAAKKNNADVVICDFIINSSEKSEHYKQQMPRDLSPDAILRQLMMGELHGSTCNKLYRGTSLKKHNISFPDNISYCEDLWFNSRLYKNQDIKTSYADRAFYHYDLYSNSSGLSRKFSAKSVEDYNAFANFIFNDLDESEYSDEFAMIRFNLKKLAFRSDCQSSLFYSIFPDSLDEFKRELTSSQVHWAMKNGLCFALNGHLKSGRLLLSLYEHGYLPVARALKSLI